MSKVQRFRIGRAKQKPNFVMDREREYADFARVGFAPAPELQPNAELLLEASQSFFRWFNAFFGEKRQAKRMDLIMLAHNLSWILHAEILQDSAPEERPFLLDIIEAQFTARLALARKGRRITPDMDEAAAVGNER